MIRKQTIKLPTSNENLSQATPSLTTKIVSLLYFFCERLKTFEKVSHPVMALPHPCTTPYSPQFSRNQLRVKCASLQRWRIFHHSSNNHLSFLSTKSVSKRTHKCANLSSSQSTKLPVIQSKNQTKNQPTNQPVIQPTNHSTNQPFGIQPIISIYPTNIHPAIQHPTNLHPTSQNPTNSR